MNKTLKYHVTLTLFLIVFAILSCNGNNNDSDEVNPLLLRGFVRSEGEATKRRMIAAVRKTDVPEGLIVDPLGDLYMYHHVYKPLIREVPKEEVEALCKVLESEREKFRATVYPKVQGKGHTILLPDNPEHVAGVEGYRLYREYMDEFKGIVGNCEVIVTNKEVSDW